ncbi:hypothetical protein ACFE04_023585 [Oxalis oulophora]
MISFTNEEPENATTPTNNFVLLKTLVHTFPLSFTFLLYMGSVIRWLSLAGVVILGAFIAGAWDLAFDAYGYSVVCIANLCTAVYLASIARIGKASGLNTFGLMWCNGEII